VCPCVYVCDVGCDVGWGDMGVYVVCGVYEERVMGEVTGAQPQRVG
jgi:hypothetical protein